MQQNRIAHGATVYPVRLSRAEEMVKGGSFLKRHWGETKLLYVPEAGCSEAQTIDPFLLFLWMSNVRWQLLLRDEEKPRCYVFRVATVLSSQGALVLFEAGLLAEPESTSAHV